MKLVPNEAFAGIVGSIFAWFVAEDWGIKRIASKLNHAGVPAPRGKMWLKVPSAGF